MSDQYLTAILKLTESVSNATSKIDGLDSVLRSHMEHEDKERAELVATLQTQERLLAKLTEDLADVAKVKTAFLVDDHGNPEYEPHRNDHSIRKEDAKTSKLRWEKFRDGLWEKLGNGAGMAILFVILLVAKDIATDYFKHPNVVSEIQKQLEKVDK